MASSDSEMDGDDLQQSLIKHLGAFLDDQIEETEIVKTKKRKKRAKTQETIEASSHFDTNSDLPVKMKIDSSDKINKTVGKIKQLTKSAKQQNHPNNSFKLSRNKDTIKAKVEHLLQKPTYVADDESGDGDNDGNNIDDNDDDSINTVRAERSNDNDEYFGGFEHFDGDDSDQEDGDSDHDDDSGLDGESSDGETRPDSARSTKSGARGNKQLDKFKQALGITENDVKISRTLREQSAAHGGPGQVIQQVPTVAALKGKPRPPPTLVVFDDRHAKKNLPKSYRRGRDVGGDSSLAADESDERFDLKRARFEVRKLGVSGLLGAKKEAGIVDMMVKLGAKPPKRKYVNYKDLQVERKEELLRAAEKRALDKKLGFKVVNPTKKKSRDKNDVGDVDGQIGTYRNGVQRLKQKAIQQVTQKKLPRR